MAVGTKAAIRTAREALAFVEKHGIVLESARGPVPNLAAEIAGEVIRGSWWGHPQGNLIYLLTSSVRDSPDVLVCRMAGGKITFVHRRIWPAVVRMAARFDAERIARLREEHVHGGTHRVIRVAFPGWVPAQVRKAGNRMSESEAIRMLGAAAPRV